MRWEDVLKRDDIIGGDLETHEDGYVYRGPISKAELKNGAIHFESPWTARMGDDGKWKNWHINTCFTDAETSPPQDIGNGRIQFNMPYFGFGVIFPKGGSKLDPSKVKGLKLMEVVKDFLEPERIIEDLQNDLQKIEQKLIERE